MNKNQNLDNKNIIGYFYCKICELDLQSQVCFDQHNSGKNHKKKLELKETKQISSLNTQSMILEAKPASNIQIKAKEFKCDLCSITCTSKDHLELHLSGRKHKLKEHIKINCKSNQSETKPTDLVQQLDKKEEVTNCEICDMKFNYNFELKTHLAGKKHLKKVKSLSDTKLENTAAFLVPLNFSSEARKPIGESELNGLLNDLIARKGRIHENQEAKIKRLEAEEYVDNLRESVPSDDSSKQEIQMVQIENSQIDHKKLELLIKSCQTKQ
jgi:hypothetical protein